MPTNTEVEAHKTAWNTKSTDHYNVHVNCNCIITCVTMYDCVDNTHTYSGGLQHWTQRPSAAPVRPSEDTATINHVAIASELISARIKLTALAIALICTASS